MKEQRKDKQIFVKKLRNYCIKRLLENNLILSGYFNMTLGNKDRSTSNKEICESQNKFMSFIMEFDPEDFWKRQNPNGRLYTHFHSRSKTYFRARVHVCVCLYSFTIKASSFCNDI